MQEIKITKTYKSDIIIGICECCSNCIKYIDEYGQNFYCLIDDEYKYPENKNFKCPWLVKEKNR